MLTTGQLNFNRNCEDDVRFSHRIGDGKAISKDDQHHSHSHLNVYRTNIRCVFFYVHTLMCDYEFMSYEDNRWRGKVNFI